MTILIKDNGLSITSKAEVGQLNEALPCETVSKEMRVGLDVFFLIDAVKVVDQKENRLSFTGPLTPICVAPASEAVKLLGILIPMRITGE